VAVLSGGERSRLLLAKIFLRRPNLLIMDEATNHLDLESRVLLENALAEYDGSLIFVSHDRAFVNAIATAIWHIRDARLTRYEGNIDDNVERLFPREETAERAPAAGSAVQRDGGGQEQLSRGTPRPGANRFRVERIEKEIAELEEQMRAEREKMLNADALRDGRVFAGIEQRCIELQKQLDVRYKEWEEVCG